MEQEFTSIERGVEEFLKSIGFSKNEVKTYLHLAKCGSFCPALRIAKGSGIHRSNAYDTLRGLVEKGFVQEVTEDNKKKFGVVNPEKIKEYLKQREIEVESVIEKIKKISVNTTTTEGVSVTRGCPAARQTFLDLLKLKEEIKGYGFSKDAVFALGEGFIEEFNKMREKEKIKMRFICNEEIKSGLKMKDTKSAQLKYFPKEYNSRVSTIIQGNSVVKIIFIGPPSPCIVITTKGKEISDDYNNIFEIIWKNF